MDNEEKHDEESTETKKTNEEEKKQTSNEKTPSKEDLEKDLKRVMDELKRQQKGNKKGGKPRVFALEFGGVYHANQFINFLFSYLLNVTLIFLVIEVFNFASYDSILIVFAVGGVFTIIETMLKVYIFSHHFKWVLRTFGTIFYFAYVFIFYAIDRYIFIDSFRFVNETLLVFFVLIFASLRYGVGLMIRRYLRQGLRG
ncbi:MAG: hypothetical protein UMR38_02560 [Candidatus Izemoplasma sp.]|nr:hypothetical protein [Candidatus Izemoplasma sp.]